MRGLYIMASMTKRTRTALFFLMGAVFLLFAPALVLYSQGYRWDLAERRLSQVGAFYFSVTPTRADVFLSGKLIGKTAPVLGTILTKNFSAGSYRIHIRKEGYHPWEKQLTIAPKQVTEAKHVVLFPQNLAWNEVQEKVEVVWLAPNKTEALLQKFEDSRWTLSLWNIQTHGEYLLYAANQTEVLKEVRWTSDSNSFIFQLETQGELTSFRQRVDRLVFARPSDAKESLLMAAQMREIIPLNEDDAAQSAPPPEHAQVEELRAAFPELVVSPDEKRAAYLEGKEIWIFFLKEDREQPARQSGEKVFLTRFSEEAANLHWLTPHYLLFTKGDTITITEIDTRDRLNMIEIASFANPRVFWLDAHKTLMVHSEGKLYLSAKLLP